MFIVSKGELWAIRSALEEKESEAIADALTIVEGVLDNGINVEVDQDEGEVDDNGMPRVVTRMKLVPVYEEEMADALQES